ncbi:hypothetical protein OJ996_20550 [Luteolibacter sp. GHJ8]|uniref:PEP-CTERM sorting domain-containing protein n=1 Tax=Luteolibacter rhizosphaerae TaxID=2989719 RepID=A0ABT3G859_9BACT|nr:hypothetical protein [Luteolibacter rhizosphaerae]MCW1915990.1 hypothetical protein [Luteolibacter rhizosphaerae]
MNALTHIVLAAALAFPASAAVVFQNPGLDGTPGYGSAPTSWNAVPLGTPYSEATSADGAASILMGPTGPNVSNGYFGTPHSGDTFAGGIYRIISGNQYQQGIQQSVSGFTVGQEYSFSFYQAVVGYSGAQDDSGSWRVFANGVLIETTDPSTTTVAWNTPGKPLEWQERVITFTATSETINWAFLSFDPEGSGLTAEDGVMMGIDSFSAINPVPETSTALLGAFGMIALLRRRRN